MTCDSTELHGYSDRGLLRFVLVGVVPGMESSHRCASRCCLGHWIRAAIRRQEMVLGLLDLECGSRFGGGLPLLSLLIKIVEWSKL